MTSANKTKIIVAIVGALGVALGSAMPDLVKWLLREPPASVAAAPIANEPAKPATVAHAPVALATITPASAGTVEPKPAPAPVRRGPRLPIVAHIRMGQAYPLLDELIIYPSLRVGGDRGNFITLESTALGPMGVEFRVGGAASDVVVKGEAYSLKVTDWQSEDQMLTVVLSRKRD